MVQVLSLEIKEFLDTHPPPQAKKQPPKQQNKPPKPSPLKCKFKIGNNKIKIL